MHSRVLILVLLLTGCAAQRVDMSLVRDPALLRINEAFVRTVEEARADPSLSWHAGWVGNIFVNMSGGEANDVYGLCYHWQEWVYHRMRPTIEAIGWESVGVAINVDAAHEHHAVVVYDPAVAERDAILESPDETEAYVLDAWRRGRPDIYRIGPWLELPVSITVAPTLEGVPDTFGKRLAE